MILTKDEFIAALDGEVHILLHLASKVDPAKLNYRPTPNQRSLGELLQYLVIMGPIHLRGAVAKTFDMEAWGVEWQTEEARAKELTLEQIREEIGKQPALFAGLLGPCTDADLRAEVELFGRKASRGSMLASLVLCHYAAYRMQLFLYLKSSGREELNTFNLWVGIDAAIPVRSSR